MSPVGFAPPAGAANPDGTVAPDSAAAGAERTLAVAAFAGPAAGLLLVVGQAATLPASPARVPLLAVCAVAALNAGLLAASSWRRGRLVPARVATDAAIRAALLAASFLCCWHGGGLAAVTGRDNSPLYDFLVITAAIPGLVRWPLPVALAAVTPVTVTSAAGELALGNPLWNVLPNASAFYGTTLIAALVARQVRAVARRTDAYHRETAERAAALSAAAERHRHAEPLRQRVLATLTEVLESGAIADPRLAGQARRELTWLHGLLSHGPREPDGDLPDLLRALAAERADTGPRVELDLPAGDLPPGGRGAPALVQAAREALTNVAKHSGSDVARLSLRQTVDGWLVEVADDGRGFDPAVVPAGLGLARSVRDRMSRAGGHSAVRSTPGRGTVVLLWAPR
ncbi:ATP-binding protein [Longispora sp. K20-0274]|uniref:sensor histidine kinase n=1 Tax=Longispora sp. K20-0274 TaxID=3088255 RepID=UPI00399AC5A6